MATPSPKAHAIGDRIAALSALDIPSQPVAKQVRSLLKPGKVKDALSGTWLGHALHPVLTDLVIGSWTSATLLDLIGGKASQPAADKLVGIGILAYGPTALTGASDYADSEVGDDAVRRIGFVHAASNAVALSLYISSYAARRRGDRARGVALGLAGMGVASGGAWLGGDLAYAKGLGVDQTRFDSGPSEWSDAIGAAELAEGQPASATIDGVDVLLVRQGGRVHALADRCNHRGGPLHEGRLVDGCIECPWHMSRFRLEDGSVAQGPATFRQPVYEARERDGRVEVRVAA